ncbi:hypothetical protein [Hymenobacter nivis]|uniref:Glycosyltransferase RgtA/B/C/D-like domain-containing protein n=1 Tax=Hymenobacter nivis TaxID=1850093 RepID=A0A502GPI9_9BACT|nr:hypothetical protein [Hymenobacter nivis]TPG62916.1 hypothetical protein EAH73_17780 [Hymenobacter nivis]
MWPLLAGLVLLQAALYNGFPLVTSDTGTYLVSALDLTVPIDRPVTYGLFIRGTSLLVRSLWSTAFMQCLLLGVLLLRYIREFAPRLVHPAGRLALLVLAVWATGASWFSSQLMPDIFTAIGVLALGLVLLDRCRGGWEQAAWLAVALLAELAHSSNLLIFNSIVVLTGLIAWWAPVTGPARLRPGQWALALAVMLMGWVALPSLQAALGGGFTIVRAAPAFLMARLSESGVLERFLDRECSGPNNYSLCKYRDKLPDDAMGFMWQTDTPMQLAGGMEATRDEYLRIIGIVLRSPRYYPALAWTSVQATLRQLTHVSVGDGIAPYRENTAPWWPMRSYPYELKAYMSSMQSHGQLSFGEINERAGLAYLLAVVAGLSGLASRAVRRRLEPGAVAWLALVGTALVTNAFATGAVANVYDRLQARVAWLLPFAVLVLATELLLGLWADWRARPKATAVD